MDNLRVFLSDDHAIVRAGLKALIDAQPGMEVVGEAGDGLDTCRTARECQPDVVVMDVSMPEFNGVLAAARLKAACPRVKVLALSDCDDQDSLRELFEAGASGYVLKRSAADELIRAIRSVAAGGVYLDPSLAGKVVGSFVRKPAFFADGNHDLSERETGVLRLLAQGYTNKEIAVRLAISVKTVETYKARSMGKLGLSSRVELVRYALRHGWLQNA